MAVHQNRVDGAFQEVVVRHTGGGELTEVAIGKDVVPQVGVARFRIGVRVVGLDAVVHVGDQRGAFGIGGETLAEADVATIGL